MKLTIDKKWTPALLLLPLLFWANLMLGSDYKPEIRTKIEWDKGMISSYAVDSIKSDIKLTEKSINALRMDSYRRSRVLAEELLAEKILSVQVDANRNLEAVLGGSDYAKRELAQTLQNRVIIKQSPAGFYRSECKAYITFGEIIRLLPFDFPAHNFPEYTYTGKATEYTSLVIDVRGIDFFPMLFPSILDEGGLEVYSKEYVDITEAEPAGIVHYTFDEESAMSHSKAGDHPYFTIALKTVNNCPVIAYEDIERFFSNKSNSDYLKKCRVFFIIDRNRSEQ